MRTIEQATRAYEDWLATETKLITADLATKHSLMAQGPFPFLRGSFYRWLQVWPDLCEELMGAPRVLAVGDLHVENFGTWRDAEARLVWGINDFDEAAHLPYTNDLVRLACSALLAVDLSHLGMKERSVCEAIVEGYSDGLAKGGRVFLLAEEHGWLRRIATEQLRNPHDFWERMSAWPGISRNTVPAAARKALEHTLPAKGMPVKLVRRQAGLGSRGHQRYMALVEWNGGKLAREAKSVTPPASTWLSGKRADKLLCAEILVHAVRSPDPCLYLDGSWIVRRLSPDSTKIDITELPSGKDEAAILYAMGWETANIHLGSRSAIAGVRKDLAKRPADWLLDSARLMSKQVRRDWKDWRE